MIKTGQRTHGVWVEVADRPMPAKGPLCSVCGAPDVDRTAPKSPVPVEKVTDTACG